MSMRDKMRDLAYSKEDAYFLKKDQDRIDKMRKEAAGRKREFAEKHKGAPYCTKERPTERSALLDEVPEVRLGLG